MRSYYKNILIWENLKRSNLLRKFLSLVKEYFNNIEHVSFSLEINENKIAIQKRSEINAAIDKAHLAILSAGVSPIIYYSPPPAIGGIADNINLISNIFNLHKFEINSRYLLDYIERAISIYEADKTNSFLRTINPFYWLFLILDYIASIPFVILGRVGFNQKKIEGSLVGKIIKAIFYLITVFAAFLTVLEKIGCLERFKSLIFKR